MILDEVSNASVLESKTIVSFDGTPLHVTLSSPASPLHKAAATVVLCDGFACDGYIWRTLLPALRAQYRVLSWHYRGHGLSGMPVQPDALGVAALRDDLLWILNACSVEQAVLLGHSMGVQVVLEAALSYPQRLRGLGLICGSFGLPLRFVHNSAWPQKAFPWLQRAMLRFPRLGQRLWQQLLASPWALRYALAYEVNPQRAQHSDLEAYFKHVRQMDGRLFVRMLAQIQAHTVEPHLTQIKLPSLIVAAERDRFTPAWLSHVMQQAIAGSELLLVPKASHIAPLEFPELINPRLMAFVARYA